MENILVVQGLPRLKAWNFQYRSLKLTTSPDDQSISFIDHNSLHISDRELLDRALKNPGISERIKGFRVAGLTPRLDQCTFLASAPFIMSCSYQFKKITLVDENLKELGALDQAFMEFKTFLAAGGSLPAGIFVATATITVKEETKADPPKFSQIEIDGNFPISAGSPTYSGSEWSAK